MKGSSKKGGIGTRRGSHDGHSARKNNWVETSQFFEEHATVKRKGGEGIRGKKRDHFECRTAGAVIIHSTQEEKKPFILSFGAVAK